MPDPRPENALLFRPEWNRATLASIGDAVITTDTEGRVTYLNPVAQSLTGWTQEDAAGKPLEIIFKIVNEGTRLTVENPAKRALLDGVVVGLANHTLLIAKDGKEWPIDDSAAPIRDANGNVSGVVLVFRDVTERKRQEQTVQDALAYADNIIATLREPFVVLEKNLKVVTANRSFYQNFHVTPEETQGRFIYDLGDRQWDIPRLRELLDEVLSTNHAFHDFTIEHDFPTIGRRFMLLNARRIVRPGNHSELILLAIEDETERKKTEQILRQSEERFRLLVESVLDYAIFMLDVHGNVVGWNAGAERIKGYRSEEIVGKHFSCFYPKDAVEAGWPEKELKTAVAKDRFEDEGWRLRKDGSKFWASVVITAVRDEAGNLRGFSKITRDLTERRQTEALIADSELRYRRLFETAQDAILILDARTGKITDANPYIQQLLGYSHEELMDKELWQLGMFEDKESIRSAFRRLQDEGYSRFEHLPLVTKSGQKAEVEFVSNVYQVDHQPIIQCNIRDTTERSRLEKQAHEQAAALAELDHRKDEFLAMLSHELRNPLAAITNAVQLLSLQKHEDKLQHQARTIIERQMGQLIRLVDDLLEVSRISTGRIHLQKERIGLNGIVERAVETTRPLMDQHRHELTVSLSPQPIWLHADASRLEQVVVNLLTNAAKYTADGGRISLAVQQEGDEAVLRVQDSGVGIAPELLPHIFDLFTQAERSLDRSQGGLGIGLCLVQRLVEKHGGRVEVSSELGQGSEFVVHLPVMMTTTTQPPSLPEVAAEPTRQSLRVLVVDDNVDAAQSLGLLLEASGHEVRSASDGLSAVEVALDFRPNVVLLDIGLPGLDGYEVAKRLRQDSSLDGVVLVAMTGYGQDADKLRSQNAGFNHHLVKPADFGKVQEILATVSEKAT